jgi:uracil-DNA glycosylase
VTSVEGLLEALARRPQTPGVANPYAGPAGAWRRHNLRTYLARTAPALALVGEAPGYRGCAVTGVPFTSRQVLSADTGGWGLFEGQGFIAHEGLGRPWAEATATLVWRHLPAALGALPGPPLLWNAFPFHPYSLRAEGAGAQRVGNRGLTRAEVEAGALYLRLVLDLFPGVQAVAVGRVAAQALARLGVTPLAALRHPAHGGATLFAEGLYGAGAALRLNTIATGPPLPADAGAIGLTLEG